MMLLTLLTQLSLSMPRFAALDPEKDDSSTESDTQKSSSKKSGSKKTTSGASEQRPTVQSGPIGQGRRPDSVQRSKVEGSKKRPNSGASEQRPTVQSGPIGQGRRPDSVQRSRVEGSKKRPNSGASEQRPTVQSGPIGRSNPSHGNRSTLSTGTKKTNNPKHQSEQKRNVEIPEAASSVGWGRAPTSKSSSKQGSRSGSSKQQSPTSKSSSKQGSRAASSKHQVRPSSSSPTVSKSNKPQSRTSVLQRKVGAMGNIYSSGYTMGEDYQDGGMGLSIGLRVAKVLGAELSVAQYTDTFELGLRERSNLPLQAVGQLYAFPRSPINPFISVGYAWNSIAVDDMVAQGQENLQIEHQSLQRGPVLGAGLELRIGKHLGITGEWRHLWYTNVDADSPVNDSADLLSAGVGIYF